MRIRTTSKSGVQGTLARYAQSGADVTIVTVMNGDKGSFDLPAEEIAEIREQECRAARGCDRRAMDRAAPFGRDAWSGIKTYI